MSRQRARLAEPQDEPRWIAAAVAAVLVLFVTLATSSLRDDSQTSDEAIHLAAGFAHITRADFAVNPEHPPLAKEIAALPLLFMNVSLPLQDPSWAGAHASAFQLPLGERFLYHNGVPFMTLLIAGRLPIVALGALLCLLVFVFARSLFGWRAGLISLTLCALDPNILAHSRLVTTDLAISFFLLLALYFLHRYLTNATTLNLALTGVAVGLTLASKFSAVVVIPSILLVLLAKRRSAALAASGVIVTIALVTLAATYAFVNLPVYLAGLKGVFSTVTGGSEAFLLGSISDKGWWYYYPVAMALKTPVPELIVFALIPFAFRAAKRGADRVDHLVLSVPLALFAAASLASARDVGLRHVLPLYPILFVLSGAIVWLLPAGRPAASAHPSARKAPALVAVVVLALWQAGSALYIHPSYLAYFNELGGGPSNGWRLLSDSNVDWGQDFIRLRRLMEAQGVDDLLLGHYGNQDPGAYGIAYQYLPGAGHIHPPPDHLVGSERTLLALSVMSLQGMFLRDKQAYRWLWEKEPLARVGWSIFVYDLTADRDALGHLAGFYDRARMPAQAAWARGRLSRMDLTAPPK
ncbi:MAG TPA: glycosyltransferase family 39 protein [Patescibacteria group bacterium]|nr:glycosyltransferase family 39 protein [Patescibacteria group bacterium]